RTGGLNGQHAAYEETKNIAANSYISVQVFEQFERLNLFTSLTDNTARFHTQQFAFLPSLAFLSHLTALPILQDSGTKLQLGSDTDMLLYNRLKDSQPLLKETMRLSRMKKPLPELD
ncbi:hypothetical protein BDQ17DRAFT_1248841, partial [Cyathus striatus]